MKKSVFLLLTIILTVAMLAGCRRQTTGQPGDPTVNSSSNTETTRETIIPSVTTRATEPTSNTTIPFATDETGDGTMGNDIIPDESTTDGSAKNHNRGIPRG